MRSTRLIIRCPPPIFRSNLWLPTMPDLLLPPPVLAAAEERLSARYNLRRIILARNTLRTAARRQKYFIGEYADATACIHIHTEPLYTRIAVIIVKSKNFSPNVNGTVNDDGRSPFFPALISLPLPAFHVKFFSTKFSSECGREKRNKPVCVNGARALESPIGCTKNTLHKKETAEVG